MIASFGQGTEVVHRRIAIRLTQVLPDGEDVTTWFPLTGRNETLALTDLYCGRVHLRTEQARMRPCAKRTGTLAIDHSWEVHAVRCFLRPRHQYGAGPIG